MVSSDWPDQLKLRMGTNRMNTELEGGRFMVKFAKLTLKQCLHIDRWISVLEPMILGHDRPAKSVICENVTCPLCDKPVAVYTAGNFFEISCLEDGRIIAGREYPEPRSDKL